MKALTLSDYRNISEFRYRIRQFLHFSEQVARENGLDPQQHQLLLSVKGLPEDVRPTITAVAERLGLRHHSTVELINRAVAHGFIAKHHNTGDAREILLELTPQGERLLQKLSLLHWQELQNSGPKLAAALRVIVRRSPRAVGQSA